MTDSMKFGPEWLRNMSADTTSSNSMNTSGQISNPTSVFSTVGSGGGGGDTPTANNSNSSNTNNLHNNVNSTNTLASRNTFPEFRYGREEMLLLFDRNWGIPEILPSYKNLFVERVQFPLALVPSTDEDMMQGTAPSTQRPGWLQRSPVGFSTATRGTGRVGCMERGRMRGKSVYHPVFQRPNAMFDEEQRSSSIKTDRSWAERNGGSTGDPTVTSTSTIAGGGGGGNLSSDAWNGNTPVSSPRREFTNHPRNMENWRRSRNEEGATSGEAANATAFSADGGWRMNTSAYQNSHTRWGRSTSWRDDDLSNNENAGINSGGNNSGALAPLMMRSISTIPTTHGERLGHGSVSGKPSSAGPGGVMRSISVTTCGTRNSVGAWQNTTSPANSAGPLLNMQHEGSSNDEMALPEWAMENPSDIGGTFDASGAFHGAIDDADNDATVAEELTDHDLITEQVTNEEPLLNETDTKKKFAKTTDDNSANSLKSQNIITSSKEITEIYQDSLSPPTTPPLHADEKLEHIGESEKSKQNQVSLTDVKLSENNNKIEHQEENESNSNTNIQNYPSRTAATSSSSNSEEIISHSNAGDYAERMMKVTDDMIEKLIMDDEDSKDDPLKSSMLSGGNKRNSHQHVYISAMQQPQHNNPPSAVSPALGAGAGVVAAGPPNMSLYNMTGGMMVDHTHNLAALHQLQQQQMAAVAIGLQPTPAPPPPPPHPQHPMTSSAPTDLWLYRDPQAKVQGPFSDLEMTEWYRAGYFNENLFVRRVCDARYRPLGELIKICNGQMPFSHSHLIPIDLNPPTPLTPPLAPVMKAQNSSQQTNEFILKTLNEQQHQQHHQQQHEKLKGNVTAAADSLSNALKSLINSVDISQVLNMHFQTLQDRFIHNQEIELANELAKNECFRRLTPVEQEAVIRQKLQTTVLPEYLTNLTGLSNSLAALNPTAGNQLYDTIAECTKKEQLFTNHQSQQPQTPVTSQQQQPQQQRSSTTTSYMNAEDFIKNTGHDLNSNDLLNEFNLRMFLNNNSEAGGSTGTPCVNAKPNSHGREFLNDSQLFGNANSTPTPNPSNNNSQSPMMQMWMNSLTTNHQTNTISTPQHSLLVNTQQANAVNNQWLNGPLVGIPAISLSREQNAGGINMMATSKPTPTSMWDVATLEQHVQVQQQQQQQQHQHRHELQLQHQIQQQTFEHQQQRLLEINKKTSQEHMEQQKETHILKEDNKQEEQQHQMLTNEQQKTQEEKTKNSSSPNDNNKLEQQQHQVQQQLANNNEKSQTNNIHKRNSTNNNVKPANKYKNETFAEQNSNFKKTEEERRREQNEEKRRQKEERKRQQLEDEKRRLQQAEEEKRRQMQEEEKRQQQIQAQRRKALMINTNNGNNFNGNNNNNSSPNSAITAANHKSKEQRVQSSVAPWSTQTMATKSQGPGLAEIQKAERRERRADQQRQLEIQEKQMRALAAAAEAQDAVLKWNAAPVQVKSFAEIQAEEAKRLAHEQMELQRRKDLEAHNNLMAFSSTGNVPNAGGLNSSTNISSIWSGNKIWGTPATTTGFWEEPLKLNTKPTNAGLTNSGYNSTFLTAASIVSQSTSMQPKSATAQQQQLQLCATQQPANKNIKKSQSVAVMQNSQNTTAASASPAATAANTSSGLSHQKKSNNSLSATKQVKNQKPDNNLAAASSGGNNENKKNSSKNNNSAVNKADDFESEFTNWCTKSLNNMNTKVDVPTFVSFLRDLESPYEVKDYIRMYLGESKEYLDFAKQFLERRSKYKNLQRAQNAHDDDLCKPAQAITPSVNDYSENKGKQKKVKKNKMTKLDARILGFSVTAAEGRINVGDRDYGDAP